MLTDCARAFSHAPESTCSDGDAFRMLLDLTIRIVKIWSCGDLCVGLQETWFRILTPVVFRFPLPQGISSIILVFITVT